MIKIAATIGTALLCAGLLTVLPGMTPDVAAGTPKAQSVGVHGETASAPTTGKADRLDVRAPGSGCSQRAWPHYEPDCLADFDARWRGEPRRVRLVTTDRVN
jgi:hypothetical protein